MEQLLLAARMNAFLFDAPRRTGPVRGTEAEQVPYPVVAVLDRRRVRKAPPREIIILHAAHQEPSPNFPLSEFSSCQTGWCQKTPMTAAVARSPPRSGGRRRHCAPRMH